MDFQSLFTFQGRASRAEYWGAYGKLLLVSLVLCGAGAMMSPALEALVVTLPLLVLNLYFVMLCVRRLHDTGRSGWWLLGFGIAFTLWSCVASILTVCALTLASGFHTLLPCLALDGISFVGFTAYSIWVLGIQPSQPGHNQYGAPPQAVAPF